MIGCPETYIPETNHEVAKYHFAVSQTKPTEQLNERITQPTNNKSAKKWNPQPLLLLLPSLLPFSLILQRITNVMVQRLSNCFYSSNWTTTKSL